MEDNEDSPIQTQDIQKENTAEKEDKIKSLLSDLYGKEHKVEDLYQRFNDLCSRYRSSRPEELKELETQTPKDWYKSSNNVGYILYPDLFAPEAPVGQKLNEVKDRLPYMEDLGITLIHILPILKSSGDAGFAVDNYKEIDSKFGTMEDFEELTDESHKRGIHIALDIILNHTSDNHPWAVAAKNGDKYYQDFYIFDDKGETWPGVPEIFHEFAPGHWDFVPELNKWVWSTFYKRHPLGVKEEKFPFAQWDLNYKNPDVLFGMMDNLFFLANQGVDAFRLDAVPFLWKEKGTSCTGLPQNHEILKLLHFGLEKVSPNSIFLAEAYELPKDLVEYFGNGDEAQTAYNITMMIALWKTAATADTTTLKDIATKMPKIPQSSEWMLFTECHDSVGIDKIDEETNIVLYKYFTKNSGLPFQLIEGKEYSLSVAGTTWTLLGENMDLVTLLDAVKLTIGGIPLFYMGEELGVENDYNYKNDPLKKDDNRFVKRIAITDEMKERRNIPGTKENKLFSRIKELITLRKSHPTSNLPPKFFETGNKAVLGYLKEEEDTLYLANFSNKEENATLPNKTKINLKPYQFLIV